MALKDIWSKTSNWLQAHKLSSAPDSELHLDEEGLISQPGDSTQKTPDEHQVQTDQPVVNMVQPRDKTQSLETLQAGFDKLIEQLQGVNNHLNDQAARYEDLAGRMDKLPELLEGFPAIVENQKQLTGQLLERLSAAAVKNEQFVESVEKIPTETAKQTDALVDINHQLAAAADTDVQMTESFNKFNETLEKLDQSTTSQTDGIMQMSHTFAASDRYLKYIMSRQSKRFMWVFMIGIGVCVFAIAVLTVIIIYLRQ